MSTLTSQSYSLLTIPQLSRPCDDLDGVRPVFDSQACYVGGFQKTIERRKKFVGVRRRPSGRWVAEIKDTGKKIRLWLGTFKTAEEAAMAYDEAACLLRGFNTRTNFAAKVPDCDSPVASRIRRLLSLKKDSPASKPICKIEKQSKSNSRNCFSGSSDEEIQGPAEDLKPELISESYSAFRTPVNDFDQNGSSFDEGGNGSTSFLGPAFDLGSCDLQLPSTNEIFLAAMDEHLRGRYGSYVDEGMGFHRMSIERRISACNGVQDQSGNFDSFSSLLCSSSGVPWTNYGAWNIKESLASSYDENLDGQGVFEAIWDVGPICRT
ncbi:hypothetical protein SUGI_0017700 [Cryptomeria japonica]|uniref:ethylene-responsive transcription factor ERN1-like n=1 Tax=Cryptomeria japonica TaxID=3369 RepID=UPI002408CD15|nr:ethylene-responsive transcription factor ERN1-like [Cryptomeria japonica]GLJ05407.1 hypothetical protein SUGI_0017700 [Cryptomeria japonica]